MKKVLMLINQYGIKTDVFGKYREPVRRSNRSAVKVLSIAGTAYAVQMIVSCILNRPKMPLSGLLLCAFLLLACAAGAAVAFRPDSSGTGLLLTGHLITAGLFSLGVFWAAAFDTYAFWIGTQAVAGVFLMDYAWRTGALQLASYSALVIAWKANGTASDPTGILLSSLFLAAGLIATYMVNHSRAVMITDREDSRTQADTDRLTGLTDRTAAQQEIEEHLKTDDQGVLMLLDLDRFKNINNRLGHQVGDRVLADVATDMRKMFRNSDVLSRLDGDEFVIYLKSLSEKDQALQRASQAVQESRRWAGDGTTNIQVTASVGIAMTDMVARTYDDLYRAADIALYTAKHEGGNRAMFYSKEMLNSHESVEDAV